MFWKDLKKILLEPTEYSLKAGNAWYLVLLFRVVAIGTVGYSVYESNDRDFYCNTLQPGCPETCYHDMYSVTPMRFYLFQLLCIFSPVAAYHIYHFLVKSANKVGKDTDMGAARDLSTLNTQPDPMALAEKHQLIYNREPPATSMLKSMRVVYFLSVLLRSAIEALFLVLPYYVFSWDNLQNEYKFPLLSVPGIYRCDSYPCPRSVECFITRPTEKTIFLIYSVVTSLLGLLLSVAELISQIVHLVSKAG